MRFGVEALPPFMLASARYLIAAPLVFVLCTIFRLKMWPSKKELGTLAIIGILMLGIGNTAVPPATGLDDGPSRTDPVHNLAVEPEPLIDRLYQTLARYRQGDRE